MAASSDRKPGKELNLFGELAVALRKKVSNGDFYTVVANLAHDKELLERVIDMALGYCVFSFTALVDYDRSDADKYAALHESGKLTYISKGVNYPLDEDWSIGPVIDQTGRKERQFKLVRFGRELRPKPARGRLELKVGCRPALPTEADDFLDQNFSELEGLRREEKLEGVMGKTLEVVMLSSVYLNPDTGCSDVRSFSLGDNGCALHLRLFDGSFSGDCFFLGVEDEYFS